MGIDLPSTRSRVKFYRADKGWGAIVTPTLPHDVFAHFSVIDQTGFRILVAGQDIEFRYEDCWGKQGSWHYRATWARPVGLTAE